MAVNGLGIDGFVEGIGHAYLAHRAKLGASE
jgi:hypothetical protein